MESAADRQAYMAAFGVSVTVNGAGIFGIYDEWHAETLGVSASSPQLMCAAEDLPSVAAGQTVVVASASFTGTITDIQRDGTGLVLLMLGRS